MSTCFICGKNDSRAAGVFCHVSRRYCDVVIRPETAVAHDSAPAGRVIAHVSAHVARARRLLHRALAKPANLAGDHRPSQGAIPSRSAVVCPILLLVQKRFARRFRLLDGLQNSRHVAHLPAAVEHVPAFVFRAHHRLGHRHPARHLGGGQKRFVGGSRLLAGGVCGLVRAGRAAVAAGAVVRGGHRLVSRRRRAKPAL